MRKVSLVVVFALFATVLAACGSSNNNQAGGGSPAAKDKYVLKVGYENNPGEPFDLAMQEWKKITEEKSGGRLELELYPSSQLGTKADLTEQMRAGANVATLSDGAFLMDFVPDMAILMGPYLADTPEQLFELFKSDWFKDIDAQLKEKGVHILAANWLYGTRHTIATKPATTPEEMKGMKIRTPNAAIQIKAAEAMGASPTPMPLGDVYPAISQGVIDGMENPLSVIYGSKVYETAKHVSLTSHLLNVTQIIAGEPYLKTLPEDLVQLLEETTREAGEYMTELTKQKDLEYIELLKAEGVTFHEVDTSVFKEATRSVYDQFPEWTPGLYDTVQSLLK